MGFGGFQIPPSVFEALEQRQREITDNITPLGDVLAEAIRPVLEDNQKVIDGLSQNYSKLNDLYLLKERELADSREETAKLKKYNKKMLIITVVSAGIAFTSLVAMVVIATLQRSGQC